MVKQQLHVMENDEPFWICRLLVAALWTFPDLTDTLYHLHQAKYDFLSLPYR